MSADVIKKHKSITDAIDVGRLEIININAPRSTLFAYLENCTSSIRSCELCQILNRMLKNQL